ncbi:hypothetical protein P3S68_009072 [Capsicum galapagoense]
MEAMNSSSFHSSGENGGSSTEHDDFLQQILFSVPSSSSLLASKLRSITSNQWRHRRRRTRNNICCCDASARTHRRSKRRRFISASKLRQHHINGGTAGGGGGTTSAAAMLQRGLTGDQNDDALYQGNEISVQALNNGFAGSLGQTSNQSQHFQTMVALIQLIFFIYCFSCHAQLRLNISISNQPHTPNYPKIFVSIFGPLTFASYSSLLFPPLCPIISTSYSATQLLNCKFEERLYRLYRKFMSYYTDRPHSSILPI